MAGLAGVDNSTPAGAVYGRGPARPPVKRKPPGSAAPKAAGERTLSDIAAGIPKVTGDKRRTRKNQSGLAKISESAEWELSSSAAAGSSSGGGDGGDEFDEVWADAGLLEPAPGSTAPAHVNGAAKVEGKDDAEIEIFIGGDASDDDMLLRGEDSATESAAEVTGKKQLQTAGGHEQQQDQKSKVRPKAPSNSAPAHHPHHFHASKPGGDHPAVKAPSDAAPAHYPHHLQTHKAGGEHSTTREVPNDAGGQHISAHAEAGFDLELEEETVQVFLEDGDDSSDDDVRKPSSQDGDHKQKAGAEAKARDVQDAGGHMVGWSDLIKAAAPKIAQESRAAGPGTKGSPQRVAAGGSGGAGSHRMAADTHAAEEGASDSSAEEDDEEEEEEDDEEDDHDLERFSAATVPLKQHQVLSRAPQANNGGKKDSGRGASAVKAAAAAAPGTTATHAAPSAATASGGSSIRGEVSAKAEPSAQVVHPTVAATLELHMEDSSEEEDDALSEELRHVDRPAAAGKKGDGQSMNTQKAPQLSSATSAVSSMAEAPPATKQHGGAAQPPAVRQQRAAPDLFAAMGAAVAEVEAGGAGAHAHDEHREPAVHRAPRKLPTFDKIKARAVSSPPVANTSQSGDPGSTAADGDWNCTVCTLINKASCSVCSACDTPRPEVQPITKPAPQKLGLLEMMDTAVQDTEAVNIDFEDEVDDIGDVRKVMTDSIPPEVAGLEDKAQGSFDRSADARRAASGMAAQLLSTSNGAAAHLEPPKPKQRIVGKADVVDQFLKQGPKEEKEERTAADGSTFSMGTGLGGLRKAYDVGSAVGSGGAERAPLPVASNRPKAPEETAEEESPQAGLESEWDDVGARTEAMAKEAQEHYGKVSVSEDITTHPINYKEVYQWILQLDVDYDVLRPYQDQDDGGAGCGCMSSKPKSGIRGLPASATREKDLVLFLKCTDFDFNNVTHFRMLRTIYTKLTRNKSCASIGRHWEVLGFQAGDPRTDLNRSGGVLNIVHLFYFLAHHFEILKAAWLLSQDDEQNFPLACISIAITKMVMDAFLAGQLSAICKKNSTKGVLETLNQLHTAGLFHFYSQWRHLKRTIRDTEQTYKEVAALLTRKPAKLLDLMAQGVEAERARQDPSKLEFTNLDFGTAGGSSGAQNSSAAAGRGGQKAPSVPKRLRNYHDGSGG